MATLLPDGPSPSVQTMTSNLITAVERVAEMGEFDSLVEKNPDIAWKFRSVRRLFGLPKSAVEELDELCRRDGSFKDEHIDLVFRWRPITEAHPHPFLLLFYGDGIFECSLFAPVDAEYWRYLERPPISPKSGSRRSAH